GETAAAVLDGFTIQHGAGTGAPPHVAGGGVYCAGASPTLSRLDVKSCRALQGSGLYFESSSAALRDSMIESNLDWTYGDHTYGIGIWSSGAIAVDNCTIRDNNTEAYEGGGIFGTGTYTGCTI